jgi:hypothetical protein
MNKRNRNMNFIKLTFLTCLVLGLITGCGSEKEEPCNLGATISLNGNAECVTGKVTYFKKNGTIGESIGIQFSNAIGKPFITIQTSRRPLGVGNYQQYNFTTDDGSNFTRENQTFLKSVVVEITKMDREKKLISGRFDAEAEAGTFGGVHNLSKFSGTFTDISFP